MQAKYGWYGERGYAGLYICNNTMKKRKKEYNVREMNHMIKKKKFNSHAATDFSPRRVPKRETKRSQYNSHKSTFHAD